MACNTKAKFQLGDRVGFQNGLSGSGTVVGVKLETEFSQEENRYFQNEVVTVQFDGEEFADEFDQSELVRL